MVMQVTSPPLQLMLDQCDHMSRFGLNVPKYFLIHDDVSMHDLFNEWVPTEDIDRLKMYRFERDSEEEEHNLPTDIERLMSNITSERVSKYYYLAMPYINQDEFIMSGWVKSPSVDDPFNISFGYRNDHRIPFEDDEEHPCEILKFDPRKSIPHPSPYIGDIKRIACGFPYQACKLLWSVTNTRIGRSNSHLCFWGYEIDDEYIRD